MTKHNFYYILSFLLIFAGCTPKKTSTFRISGKIENPQQGYVILSQQKDINKKISEAVDTLKINSDGTFDTNYTLEPHIYSLNFYNKKSIMLAIDKGQHITISTKGNNLTSIQTQGSEDTEKLLAYETFRKASLQRLVKSVRNDIKALKKENNPKNNRKIEELGKLEIENYKLHKEELIEFIKNNMGASIAIYPTSIRWSGEKNMNFLDSLATAFEKEHPDLEISKRISEKVALLKRTSVGGKVADIKMPDQQGNDVALSSLKGNYTLIDFWASWCPPCRRDSKTLSELYKKYNSKGFEIYGISLDSKKELWTKALEKDQRIWTNVSTLQAFKTPVASDYGVTALPINYLIDNEGKIIAKDLHGAELKEIIEKLFVM